MLKISMLCSVLLVLVFLVGCRVHSMMVFENSVFPDAAAPNKVNKEVLGKYTVGSVIVHPRIVYADSAQTMFKLYIVFFSEQEVADIHIKNVSVVQGGKQIIYDSGIIGKNPSGWKTYSPAETFFVQHVSGKIFDAAKMQLISNEVQVLLEVVSKEGDQVFEKNIESLFVPKKRSFIE